ncbi:MAG: glycosyltransferase [Nanoarchaeota archaeon]|nr:glycosyltransferase [Nanoarchaeota archaeon]
MANKPKISILVPFFGSFDPRRLEVAMRSVQTQSEKGLEFLICTGKDVVACDICSPSFKVQDALKGLNTGANVVQDVPHGLIYNQGIRKAQGEHLYLSDSDIVFPEGFFEELIQAAGILNTPLQRPMMRRLLLQDFDKFYADVSEKGIRDALKSLDASQEFLVKPDKSIRDIKIFRKFENGRMKTFIATREDYNEYVSDPENKGSEPKFFNQERHCGATFARRSEIERIGGCCERFVSWGCWDADLQWKLKETYGISYMPGEVIHLDHPKGYFDKDKWQKDRTVQETRRDYGIIQCIQEDKGDCSSK